MAIFVFGGVLLLAAVVVVVFHKKLAQAGPRRPEWGEKGATSKPLIPPIAIIGAGVVLAVAGLVFVVVSTAIYVNDNQGGVVVVKFGSDLPANRIIATKGEKGPQGYVLPPGWHFGYWPWIYDLEAVDNIIIDEGHVGVVTAMDGQALPPGEVFAPEWKEPTEMLDGQKFLESGKGYRGPQLTVLTPGQYRYNPRLFKIIQRPYLRVPVGKVAVVKANAGNAPPPGVEEVNGTPIVPEGVRGIWQKAFTPNAYYLHPEAYEVVWVETTNRVYSYNRGREGPGDTPFDSSINVRTKDGFEFPVDVRVNVKVTVENAPYVVAMLADPDAKVDQFFTVMEQRAVLPLIRAIFRNAAESREALEFVMQRSEIESMATEKFAEGLKKFRIETDGVFVADIRIKEDQAGKKLLSTQTDRQVAIQQKETYEQQRLAEIKRAEVEKAREEANQETEKAKAVARVEIAKQDAQARIEQANGEAQAYTAKINAIGGVENFVLLQMAEMFLERWQGDLPSVMVVGGDSSGRGSLDALAARMLSQGLKKQE